MEALACRLFLGNPQARSPKHRELDPSGCFQKGTIAVLKDPLVWNTTCRKTMRKRAGLRGARPVDKVEAETSITMVLAQVDLRYERLLRR